MFHNFMSVTMQIAVTTAKLIGGLCVALISVIGIIFKSALK